VLCLAWPSAAGDFSYVVLNGGADRNSLVRVSADGSSITAIAHGAGGYGLAKDHAGNYIVAAVGSLLKVTPYGVVSTIAKTPKGSQWMSVVEDAEGMFLVVDNQQHALWRVSQDGQSVTKIWNYAAPGGDMNDIALAPDGHGNSLLLENHSAVHLFRITPAGAATEIPLGRTADFSSGLLVDAQGNYVFMNYHVGELFRVTPAGEVTRIGKVTPPAGAMAGLAQDPQTGEYIMTVMQAHSLIRISTSGSSFTTLANNETYLSYPTAVIVEQGK
jgi:hypothetical protein